MTNFLIRKHLTITFFSFVVLFGIFFGLSFILDNMVGNPKLYFGPDTSSSEAQSAFVKVALIVVSVLLSYIIYLLLASKSRVDLMVVDETKQLVSSREEFKKIYEESPVPYITLNRQGEIQSPNKAALRFFGVVPEDIEGKSIFSFIHEDDSEKSEKFSQYYSAGIPINREEVRTITKSGSIKWVLLSVFVTKNRQSSAPTGLATMFDITEQKRLDQSKTEFVSLASHQLRTPLTAIKWYVDMLNSGDLGELSPKQKSYAERVYEVTGEMIDLVDTLLNVSRVEIGTLTVDKKKINAEDLTENILTELSPDMEKKKIHLEKRYNNSLQDIESDPKLLRIVIHNLLTNAIKYSPESGEIMIEFSQSDDKQIITVSDHGLGIPKEQQDRIFNKMFRADNVTGLQGTGLGLYMIRSIVNAMGGNISFLSEEGKGSRFTVSL